MKRPPPRRYVAPWRARLAAALVLAATVVGCGAREPGPPRQLEGAEAVCEGGPVRPQLAVRGRVAALKGAPDMMRVDQGALWIVESLDNTVSRFDLADGTLEPAYFDVGNGRNPWDVHLDGQGQAWITNYLSDTVSVADVGSGQLLEELDAEALDNPSGVTGLGEHVFVTNVQVSQGQGRLEFGSGSVAVFEADGHDFVGAVETAAPNPQWIEAVSTRGGARLVVVDSGAFDLFGDDPSVASAGAVEVWEITEDVLAPTRRIAPIPAPAPGGRVGSPGRPWVTPDGRHLYLTSATAPIIFKLDLESMQWVRGPEDPIVLYETEQAKTLHRGFMDSRGLFWITSFNRDELHIWDTRCDAPLGEPIQLGGDPTQSEGPTALVVAPPSGDEAWPRAYYTLSIASSLGSIAAQPGPSDP